MVDSNLPNWLVQRVYGGPQASSVSQDIALGAQLAQQRQQNEAQDTYRRAQLESMNAYREAQIKHLLTTEKVKQDEATDAGLLSEWMRDPRQPPPAGLKTPKALNTVAQIQRAYAQTEMGSRLAAINKSYADKLKDLDATGVLKVQEALDANDGRMTSDVASLIDDELSRTKTAAVDTQVLNEQGKTYVPGQGKPVFLQSLKTGALHKLPPDWSGGMKLIPLTDDAGVVRGYGVPNSSGGITQLRSEKTKAEGMEPAAKAAMTVQFGALRDWYKEALQFPPVDATTGKRMTQGDVSAMFRKRLKELRDEYGTELDEDEPDDTKPSSTKVWKYNPATKTFE